MAEFDSYIIDESLVGSLMNSRYQNLNPQIVSMCQSNVAGSVVLCIKR